MVATAIQKTSITQSNGHSPKSISWVEFEKKFLSLEDGFKYEWVNGIVEKTPRAMNQNQYYLLDNPSVLLNKYFAFHKKRNYFC